MSVRIIPSFALVLLLIPLCTLSAAGPQDYFVIQIIDDSTGRGVPLVELRTTDEVSYYTDSSGVVAFAEPGLMNRRVFFTITSPGYEFPADGFGFHGIALQTVPGKRATLKIKRINIAERLYRITGAGIYRDSVLAGLPVPPGSTLLNGDVVGQDSVLAVPHHGAIHWFWGDTSRPDYPLGNFGTTGAVSVLPATPDKGIELRYFTGADGFTRPMLPLKGPGPVWVGGVQSVDDGAHLIAYFSRMQSLSHVLERGLAVYNDGKNLFEPVCSFDASKPMPLDGHPFLANASGTTFLFGTCGGAAPLPIVRAPATVSALKEIGQYEHYTCLKSGSSDAHPEVERESGGQPAYGWKLGAPCLTASIQKRLIAERALKPEEGLFQLRDVETGRSIAAHNGSVYWNGYRQRWVMIFGQIGGIESNLGEIWFSEADSAVGPWIFARKIATHPKMDFYNPTQHPFFDDENGKRIYFEGTYVNSFSGNPIAIPRYNYNQIMYRLSLDDPRLSLPAPVYRLASGTLRMREGIKQPAEAADIRSISFYAVPPNHPHPGMIPISLDANGQFSASNGAGSAVVCFIRPPSIGSALDMFAIKDRGGRTIGYAWRNPQTVMPIDFSIMPAHR